MREIARLVRGGDIWQMERLLAKWPPSGTVIEAFDAFLPHFSIPDTEENRLSSLTVVDRLRRARLACLALLHCIEDSRSLPELKAAISSRILSNLEKIIWWHTELFTTIDLKGSKDSGNGVNPLIGFLLPAYGLTLEIGDAIVNLPAALELIALALSYGCLTQSLSERPREYYPILLKLVTRLLNEDDSGIFCDSISKRGSSAINGFVETMIGIPIFLKGYDFLGDNPREVSRTLADLRDTLTSLSADARFSASLRRQRYINHFVELLVLLFDRVPACQPDMVVQITEAFNWIKMDQPHKYHKSLVLGFVQNQGFLILVHAVQTYIAQAKAKETMFLFLGFTSSSRRIREAIKNVLDEMEIRHSIRPRVGLPLRSPGSINRTYFPWTNFALSFEARFPQDESVETTKLGEPLTFCNNTNVSGSRYCLDVNLLIGLG
jgi:hypothetical protein